MKTNLYYHQYLNTLKGGSSPLPDMNESEMFFFFTIIIQIGHCIQDRVTDY